MDSQGWFSNKNIATFIIVFMSLQLCWIEGFQTSVLKIAMMALSPIIILFRSPRFSSAIAFSLLYFLVTIIIYYLQFSGNEMTFVHIALQLAMFCTIYNLVHIEECFSIDDAIKLVKMVVYIYAIFFILQQIFYLVGLRYFPPLNLFGFPYYGLFRLPSAAIEPSHAARILTVYGYAFLKLNEFKNQGPCSISSLFSNNRLFVICYLYTIIGIGSGTAMVGLGMLFLYFIKIQYSIYIIIAILITFFVSPYIDYEPLNRAISILDASMSFDTYEIYKTDQSAATRINIIFTTFQNVDLTDSSTWFGHGVFLGVPDVVEGIAYYGLISYLLLLLLLFRCCFTRIISLEILFFVFLLSMYPRNFAYAWAILLVLTMVKHFYQQNKYEYKGR